VDYILLLNPDAHLKNDFFYELEKIINESKTSIPGPISPLILLDVKLFKANLGRAINVGKNEVITLINGHQNFRVYDNQGRIVSDNSSAHLRVKSDYLLVSTERPESSVVIWTSSLNANAPVKISTLDVDEFSSGHLINNAGSYIHPPFIAGDFGFQDLYLPEKLNQNHIRSAWCGACVVLSKDYFNEVGMFDEEFFLYYEDVELSLRGMKKGFTTTFYPNLVCVHGHSKSTSLNIRSRSYNIWRSRSLFIVKTYGMGFSIILIIKLVRDILNPSINRSRLKHIRNNLFPELRATIRGMFRLK
jgi:hypothetical protein